VEIGHLSDHFWRYEVACKCGCGADSMDVETLHLAELVRDFVDAPISPSSGYRCLEYNRKIGSGDKSQHPKARAMDLPVPDPTKVYDYLCRLYPDRFGFGLYDTFVHIDTRTIGPARWDNRSK
jgi:zinc D-Ala-D-Ala carboxypeptidase